MFSFYFSRFTVKKHGRFAWIFVVCCASCRDFFVTQKLRPDALPPFDAPRYSHLTRFFGRLEWEDLGFGLVFSWICVCGFFKKNQNGKYNDSLNDSLPKWQLVIHFGLVKCLCRLPRMVSGMKDQQDSSQAFRDGGGLRRPLIFVVYV